MSRRLTGARPIRALCLTSLVNIHERRRRRSRIGKLVSLLDVFRSPKPFWTRFSSVHVRIGPWPAILALAREKLHTHERDLCGTRRLFRTGRRFCWNRRFSWWICACVKVWLNPIAGWTSGRRSLGLVCVCACACIWVCVHMSMCVCLPDRFKCVQSRKHWKGENPACFCVTRGICSLPGWLLHFFWELLVQVSALLFLWPDLGEICMLFGLFFYYINARDMMH